MPVIFQKMIYRSDLQDNPNVLYVFGDNDMRKGRGGQAAEMRDEPNAVGVRTKWTPGIGPNAYFTDSDFDEIIKMIDDDLEEIFEALENDRIVVIPSDGVGTGLALLNENAPKVFKYLQDKMETLKEYGVAEF